MTEICGCLSSPWVGGGVKLIIGVVELEISDYVGGEIEVHDYQPCITVFLKMVLKSAW